MAGQGGANTGIDADKQHAHSGLDAIAQRREQAQAGGHERSPVCVMLRAMRTIAIVTSSFSPYGDACRRSLRDAEREAVLKTVQTFFDTMTAQDVEGARKVLQPQGRFHAMRMRNGKPDVREFSNKEYFAILQASKQKMRERIWNPEVRIQGLIATVRAPYDFWIDGKLSHCGVDAFDLIKTQEGWKLAGGVYTVENNCAPSPLGPLKQ